MHRRRLMAAGLLAAALAGGCSTTNPFGRERLAVDPATQYVGGRGWGMYPTTDDIVANVRGAMTDLGMRSIHQVPEPNGVIALEATTADRRSARATIATTGVRSTVALKVGWAGDEPLTRSFLQKVEDRQGALAPSLIPAEPDPAEPAPGGRFARSAVPDAVMQRNQLDQGFRVSESP